MKLSEMIAKYGDDDVKFQNLDDCAIDLNYTAKSGTRITFGTDVPINLQGTKELGFVVWFDRDKIKEIVK